MKKWVLIVCLFFGAGGVFVAAGPYITISAIKSGVAEQDTEKLSENIDFPILRQNLKDQLNMVMMKKAQTELKDNPFAALAAGFATKFVDGMVETFVTPVGIAAMMEGKKPSKSVAAQGSTSPNRDDLFKNTRTSYDSFSKFSIWVANDSGEETRFVLQRNGLDWRLVNIVIPMAQ